MEAVLPGSVFLFEAMRSSSFTGREFAATQRGLASSSGLSIIRRFSATAGSATAGAAVSADAAVTFTRTDFGAAVRFWTAGTAGVSASATDCSFCWGDMRVAMNAPVAAVARATTANVATAARRDAGRVWLPMLLVPAACDTDAYRNEAGKRGDVIMLVSTIVYELPEPALNPRHFVERKQGHTAGCPIGCLPSIQFRP